MPRPERYAQVHLGYTSADGCDHFMKCNVDADKCKQGDWITLEDSESPDVRWRVILMGDPLPKYAIHREWHNNI